MATTHRTLRLVTGAALTLGMAALWAGSIYHYGSADASAADMVADAQANPGAQLVNAVSYLLETMLFTIAAIGVAAIVRGRGRTFVLVACGVLAVGLPSHAMGATMHLTMRELATSSLPTDVQVSVVDSVNGLGAVYFALILPFLLGLVLLTAALWRARVVGWQPFAILVADIVVGMTVNGSHTPSDWMWWIDPIVTIAAFAWLAVGLGRYRADEPEPVDAPEQPALAAA
ncbi:MAG TPA: hypothetical protein VFI19_14965 [Nocardioides sp.]|nr:hypothetical protein [Nocardioides sp.]